MAPRKRKWNKANHGNDVAPYHPRPTKKVKGNSAEYPETVKHNLLDKYYPVIHTLRQYVLLRLPASSKIRKRVSESVGAQVLEREKEPRNTEPTFRHFLDTTLVGVMADFKPEADNRWEKWVDFSRQGERILEAFLLQAKVRFYPLSE